MNNILLICPHFPPIAASGAFRLLGFAKHLPKFGWNTAVVANSPVWWEPNDPRLAAQIPPETSVTRIDYPNGRLARWVSRGVEKVSGHDRYWLWAQLAAAECRRVAKAEQVDAVLTSGPPHSVHRLGAMLKRRFDIPWIADFRDPWASNMLTTGKPATILAREAAVLREADAVIANAPNAEAEFARRYPSFREKLTTITNGYDPESVPTRKRIRSADEPVEILHAGEIYAGRDPRPLLDAVREVRATQPDVPSFRVTFLGKGEWAGFPLSDEIQNRGLEGAVSVSGHVPYDEARQRMVDADVLLLLDSANRISGVPAKLYEYIGTKRPILALADARGDTAWALQHSGRAHRLADPIDVAEIRLALTQVVQHAAQPTLGTASTAPSDLFTREATTGQLATLLECTLASAGEARSVFRRGCLL